MRKTGMKYIILLCVMMGIVLGCSGKEEEKSVLKGQRSSTKISATEQEISTDLPIAEQVTEVPDGMSTTETSEEKTNTAEWIYDAQNHRLTIRGTGETHDRELTEPVDCGHHLYHLYFLPYLKECEDGEEEKIQASIKEVVIEQGITVLNMAALADLTNLEKVTIPNSVEIIDDYVFYNCKSLKEITIPDSVTSIGKDCFGECKSLEKISFGKGINTIGDGSFLECQALSQITVAPENEFFETKSGGLYQKRENTLYFYYDRSRKVSIEKDTERIGIFAFTHHDELQEINIPASVEVIGGGAFYKCRKLKKVTFAKGSKCKKIENYNMYGSFTDCGKLVKIDFPDSLRSIGAYGLASCTSLKSIQFPEKFQYIGYDCLSGCTTLKKIYFGKSFEGYLDYKLEVYDGYQAEDARLNHSFVTDARSLMEIQVSKKNPFFSARNGVMYDKKQEVLYVYPAGKTDTKYEVPKSVRKIRAKAFEDCNYLRSVDIFGEKTKIQFAAFLENANLKSVKIYGKNAKIEEEAFSQCKKLNSITMYGEKTVIAYRAFEGCDNIKSITIYGKKTKLEEESFGNSKDFTIYGKAGSKAQAFAKKYKKNFIAI